MMGTDLLSCRRARRRLAVLLDDHDGGDLGWDERRRVERHLIACSSCRSERAALESAVGVLHLAASAPPVDPDAPSLWPALARQIRGARHPRRVPWAGLGALPAWGLAASLLFVGAAIGLTGGWHLGKVSAERRNLSASNDQAFRPRPALPAGPDQVANTPPSAQKADVRLPEDLKAINPRDPMRSQ